MNAPRFFKLSFGFFGQVTRAAAVELGAAFGVTIGHAKEIAQPTYDAAKIATGIATGQATSGRNKGG